MSLARNALTGHKNWQQVWRSPDPKPSYDVIIVGGGGHGLATAYYLAKEHGITNVAVLEKGWLGGGNTGRNTTIIRSNYLFDDSAHLYEHALKLWEGLSQELNYNVMFSQRGVLNLCHDIHEARDLQRRVHANRLNGIDSEWLDRDAALAFCPLLNGDPNLRYPVYGGTLQRRGGTARHDAVAWGYARGADAGASTSSRIARSPASWSRAAGCAAWRPRAVPSRPRRSASSPPAIPASSPRDGGLPPADGEPPAAGAGLRAGQAGAQLRGHVQRRARLYQPVRQGRDGDRRRRRPLCQLYPARQASTSSRRPGRDRRAVPDLQPAAHAAAMGRDRRHLRRMPARSSARPRSRASTSIAAGAPAASRRRRAPAWVFAHTIARDEPHALNAAFSLDRFTSGDLIAEHGAAAVAH